MKYSQALNSFSVDMCCVGPSSPEKRSVGYVNNVDFRGRTRSCRFSSKFGRACRFLRERDLHFAACMRDAGMGFVRVEVSCSFFQMSSLVMSCKAFRDRLSRLRLMGCCVAFQLSMWRIC